MCILSIYKKLVIDHVVIIDRGCWGMSMLQARSIYFGSNQNYTNAYISFQSDCNSLLDISDNSSWRFSVPAQQIMFDEVAVIDLPRKSSQKDYRSGMK